MSQVTSDEKKQQSLRLKVTTLEASLRHEKAQAQKHLEQLSKLQLRVQQLERTKGSSDGQLNPLTDEEEFEICGKVLKNIYNDYFIQERDDNEETDETKQWHLQERFASIVHYGVPLFKAPVLQQIDYIEVLKRDEVRIKQAKENCVSIINNSGIRQLRNNIKRRMHYSIDAPLTPDIADINNSEVEYDKYSTVPETEIMHETMSTTLPSCLHCYICCQPFSSLHHFYDKLCGECAEFNYKKRFVHANLTKRVAVVTGGRIRIGYQTALRLLRDHCTVIVTSRFPHNTLRRYRTEPDYATFCDRLIIYGLDMRDIHAVEKFADFVRTKTNHVDILINNAAQTIRKPSQYYHELVRKEIEDMKVVSLDGQQYDVKQIMPHLQSSAAPAAIDQTPIQSLRATDGDSDSLLNEDKKHVRSVMTDSQLTVLNKLSDDIFNGETKLPAAALSVIPRTEQDYIDMSESFPVGVHDDQLDQLDLRDNNTWVQRIEDTSTMEVLEVQTINVTAPWILVQQLQPLMVRSPFEDRYIVNVTSVEGLFSHFFKRKTGYHPHTNMAKSALNMMTVTVGPQYAERYHIYMCAVDPGWVSSQSPYPTQLFVKEKLNFAPPLDEVDAASRILDPVYNGINNAQYSVADLHKNYSKSSW